MKLILRALCLASFVLLLLLAPAGCSNASPGPTTPAVTAATRAVTLAGDAALIPPMAIASPVTPTATPTVSQAPAQAPTPTETPILVTAIAPLPATPTPMPTASATAVTISLNAGALAVTLPPATAAHTPVAHTIPGAANLPDMAVLENGFQVSFLGADQHDDGSSTWRYRVERPEGAKKLQYWGLQLPDCAIVLTASPKGWEIVHSDDVPEAWGITWKTKGNFQHGEFAVRISGRVAAGTVQVAAQGPKLAVGAIIGPHCQ